jgi:sporulation protein YlmC with PRC-barrel domain
MLIATQSIYGSTVEGTDGLAGTVRDLLFDDRTWDVRHLVVHTGNWLTGKSELLSPEVIESTQWMGRRLSVRLTRQEVEESPGTDSHLPASHMRDVVQGRMIAWDAYWASELDIDEIDADPHLDSAKEVTGYHLQASDGEIGHVEDFIVDDESWKIRYLIVDTRNWMPGKHVLMLPESVSLISWNSRKIETELERAKIHDSPAYDRNIALDRRFEESLYDHYGLPVYWATPAAV